MDGFLCFLRELIRAASRIHTGKEMRWSQLGIASPAELNPAPLWDHPKEADVNEPQSREIVGSGVR
jgi:hypothetical protein